MFISGYKLQVISYLSLSLKSDLNIYNNLKAWKSDSYKWVWFNRIWAGMNILTNTYLVHTCLNLLTYINVHICAYMHNYFVVYEQIQRLMSHLKKWSGMVGPGGSCGVPRIRHLNRTRPMLERYLFLSAVQPHRQYQRFKDFPSVTIERKVSTISLVQIGYKASSCSG